MLSAVKTASFVLAITCSLSTAADVPAEPIVQKGALLFSDDFQRDELGSTWKVSIPAFTVADGVMKGTQMRADHGAVGVVKAGFKDGIVEFKFRLEGAASVNAVFDDRNYKGSHAGHICRVALAPKQIRLGDDKEGVMRNDIFAMRRDPTRKAEADKLLVGRSVSIRTELKQGRWYRLVIEIAGDAMRVVLDDKPIGVLRSPGINHPRKDTFHFTVTGKDALFDDVRIWAAQGETAKQP
jgi:hypothetical protein